MDSLTEKLQEVEAARNCALKGKANTDAATEDMKQIFTIDKAILEQAKAKIEADLLKKIEYITRT